MQTRLLRRETVAAGTIAFHFERPPGFVHQAGQSLMLTLPSSDSHPFTIASAPHERDLMIATRMRESAFKTSLASLLSVDAVSIDGPSGLMVLHDDAARAAVFLAGGIGITPFLAMARDAAHRRLPPRITLFYSNRRPEDAPFLSELDAMQRSNANFRLVAIMTADKSWHGEKGYIRRELLARHLED